MAINSMTAKWQAELQKAFPTYHNRPGRVKSCRNPVWLKFGIKVRRKCPFQQ